MKILNTFKNLDIVKYIRPANPMPNIHRAWVLAPLVPVFLALLLISANFLINGIPSLPDMKTISSREVAIHILVSTLIIGTAYAYLITFFLFWPQYLVLEHYKTRHYLAYAMIGLVTGLVSLLFTKDFWVSMLFLLCGLILGLSVRFIAGQENIGKTRKKRKRKT